mmetsp:Transcript_59073/g.139034  ORF Transcript_59073/g.139034 Transcript_59073/m.139034 type:complete len:85 (-) Transcript_59073:10-264(-)
MVVLFTCWMHNWRGWWLLDALASLFVASLIFQETALALSYIAPILLQAKPSHLAGPLDKVVREASMVTGVLECCEERFWCQVHG